MLCLSEVCVQKVNELSRHQMIWTDEDGFLVKPLGKTVSVIRITVSRCIWINRYNSHFVTICLLLSLEPGRLMTRYYLKFDTMKLIMQTPLNCTLEDALHVICRAEEISCKSTQSAYVACLNVI